MKNLKSDLIDTVKDFNEDAATVWTQYQKDLRELSRDIFLDTIVRTARLTEKELKVNINLFDVTSLNTRLSRIEGITETMKQDIIANLSTSLDSADVVAAIEKAMDGALSRAKTIARTEIGGMISDSQITAYQSAGVKKIQWNTAGDKDVRPSHQIGGQVRIIGHKFSNGLLYPREPGGAASEVINCRCYITAVISSMRRLFSRLFVR